MLAILCLWHRSQTYMLYISLYIYTCVCIYNLYIMYIMYILNLYVGSIYVYGIRWQSASDRWNLCRVAGVVRKRRP